MQLSEFFSAAQISVLRQTCTSDTPVYDYAPSVPKRILDGIMRNAARLECNIDKRFWRDLEFAYARNKSVMLDIDKYEVKVLSVQHNRVFARHIGELVKTGRQILWVCVSSLVWVGKKNWNDVYDTIVGAGKNERMQIPEGQEQYYAVMPKMRNDEYMQIRQARDKQRVFDDIARPNTYKKLGKRGYNPTFDEHKAYRILAEMESYEAKVAYKATQLINMINE